MLLVVEREERDGHGSENPAQEALPRLARRELRRQLVAPDQAAGAVRSGGCRERRENDGQRGQLRMVRQLPDEQERAEAGGDPPDSEERRPDRDRRRLSRRCDAVQREREQQRQQQPTQHPLEAAELSAEQRRDAARVAGEDERPQRADQHVELVQRDERREEQEPEEPPPT